MKRNKRAKINGESVCLAKQGQPLVHCPSFIDKGPGKCTEIKNKKNKKRPNEIINVVELMMNGNKKRLGSLWSQRAALLH